jgi:hypothetical protein
MYTTCTDFAKVFIARAEVVADLGLMLSSSHLYLRSSVA